MTRYWLMKTEPSVFSWDDLDRQRTASWEGVRNYQARNYMRDDFREGDMVFVYHSSCPEPGIAGLATVIKEAYPDPSAMDPKSQYFDPASLRAGQSRWVMVDIAPLKKFEPILALQAIRIMPDLATMTLLRRGQRLSIQPVSTEEFETITKLYPL